MPRPKVQIDRLAEFARIRITPTESAALIKEIEVMVGYFEQLKAVDTSQVAITDGKERPGEGHPDVPTESLTVKQALANGPQTDGRFFIVPKVIG